MVRDRFGVDVADGVLVADLGAQQGRLVLGDGHDDSLTVVESVLDETQGTLDSRVPAGVGVQLVSVSGARSGGGHGVIAVQPSSPVRYT